MNFINRLFKFYLNSSLHIAFSVLSLSFITAQSFAIKCDKNLFLFLFCSSVLAYNFIKYFGISKFYYRSLTTRLKEIQLLSLFCFFGLIITFFELNNTTKLLVLCLGAVTFFYEIPFERVASLRRIKGLKIYIIALVWAMTTVLLPLLEAGVEFQVSIFLTFIQRFIFIVVLMLPFEIRDLNNDDLWLSTIPQKIGITTSKRLGFLGLFLIFLVSFLLHKNSIDILTSIIVMVVTGLFLLFSHPKKPFYFTAFWVESIPVFWALLVWISNLLFQPSTL
ncbi:MAG: hypothetical protein CMC86_02630 [Flavobacteriaceae bacterium]|nr:hypothetical protein [Flavobacteriaceae bacterium]